MTIRTRFCVLATLTLAGIAAPAFAQDVPADANKSLWCATAFTLVEPQARSQGQAAAADNFLKYSKTLTGLGHDSLIKAGFTEDQVTAQNKTYTDKVTKELSGGGEAEFSVVDCTQLVDPTAAAAMAQPPAGDAPAPADGAAPAAPADAAAPAAPAAGAAAPAPTTPAPSN